MKRLNAIEEFTQMGSGFKVAMRDLEIRGAGNLLGGEQHGHMSRIGYDLYCKMIKETVDENLGKKKEEVPAASVEMKIDAYISEDYIPNEALKFASYRKISDIRDKEDMLDIRDELSDRFGEVPQSVDHLLHIAYIRTMAGRHGVSVIREESGNTVMIFSAPELNKVSDAVNTFSARCVITAGRAFAVVFKTKGISDAEKLLWLKEFLEYMDTLG